MLSIKINSFIRPTHCRVFFFFKYSTGVRNSHGATLRTQQSALPRRLGATIPEHEAHTCPEKHEKGLGLAVTRSRCLSPISSITNMSCKISHDRHKSCVSLCRIHCALRRRFIRGRDTARSARLRQPIPALVSG